MKFFLRFTSFILTAAIAIPCFSGNAGIYAEEIDENSIISVNAGGPYNVIYSTSYEDALKELPSTVTLKLQDGKTSKPEALHTAKFEKSDWTLFDPGAITFADGKIKINKQSAKVKALTGGEYDNFVVEAVLRGTASAPDNNFGLMLRATNVTDKNADSYQGYYVGIGKYGSSYALTVGYGNNAWKLIKNVPIDYKPNTDYKLKVLMYENTLAVWLDGKLLYKSELDLFDKGRVGLRTFKQLFECSSFEIRTPSGEELTECGLAAVKQTEAKVSGWSCPNYDPKTVGTYTFTAKIENTNYEVKATIDVVRPFGMIENIQSVPYSDVKITDGFFREYIKQMICVVVPTAIKNVEGAKGGFPNIKNAAKKHRGESYGAFSGAFYVDSDVHKVLESMCMALDIDAMNDAEIIAAQKQIAAKLEEWIPYFADAQEDSGYFDTYYTLNTAEEKYSNVDKHELYCMGHFIEAAIAHYEYTDGKDTRLFDVAIKCANHIASTFGNGEGKRKQIAGHQEIEYALLRLARLCKNIGGEYEKNASIYAELAAFFLEVRGDYEGRTVMGDMSQYRQDHAKVEKQYDAVGHAVRAQYMYAAMAELAALNSDYANKYNRALSFLWQDVVYTKQYVTGGVGQTKSNEGFAAEYKLDNKTSYCETCAGIANMMWNRAMSKLHAEAKYADMVERDIYNAVLGCVNFDGDKFYYQNRTAIMAEMDRNAWYGTACCPPNLTRTVLSFGEYLYKYSADTVYVDQYVTSEAKINVADTEIILLTESNMPWSGKGKITLKLDDSEEFLIKLRIPEWTDKAVLTINGIATEAQAGSDGYYSRTATWKDGDVIEFDFSMPITYEETPQQVTANAGCTAVKRGPIVYCAESADNDFNVFFAYIDKESEAELVWTDSLDGKADPYGLKDMYTLKLKGFTDDLGGKRAVEWTFIPFYARQNREIGAMTVYVQKQPIERTLEQYAIPSASYTMNSDSEHNLNDGSRDVAKRWTSWKSNEILTNTWVQYDFDMPVALEGCNIWWYKDNGSNGGVKLPKNIEIYYKNNAGSFVKVDHDGEYKADHDTSFITYSFEKIETTAIKVVMTASTGATGIREWTLIGNKIENSEPPVTDTPVTDAPATDAPATDAPATDAPVTDAPDTDAPATDAPATDEPQTDTPETNAPKNPPIGKKESKLPLIGGIIAGAAVILASAAVIFRKKKK